MIVFMIILSMLVAFAPKYESNDNYMNHILTF